MYISIRRLTRNCNTILIQRALSGSLLLKLSIMKRCPKCEIEKPFSEFYKDNGKKKRRGGVQTYCKVCADFLRAKHLNAKRHKGNPITHIECSCCKRIKEANTENFTINKTYVSGFNSRCKPCIAIKHKEYKQHGRRYLTDQYVIQILKNEIKQATGLKLKSSEISKELIKLRRKQFSIKRKFRKDPNYENAKSLRI